MQGLPTHSVGGHTRESSNGQGCGGCKDIPLLSGPGSWSKKGSGSAL